MNYEIKSLLLPFYVGAIDDKSRLAVERELLVDEELLVDYLDLKRTMESAALVPQKPSAGLWAKLERHVQPRKKFYFSVAVGAAVAASLVILSILMFRSPDISSKAGNEILFDTSRELPASSNVF